MCWNLWGGGGKYLADLLEHLRKKLDTRQSLQIDRSYGNYRVFQVVPANAGDISDSGSIPGLGRSLEVRNGHPLKYSCLENPLDRGAKLPVVRGVSKGRT